MSDRQLPSTIDYSRVLPLSIPAIAKRHKYFPQNGTNFTFQGTRQIRIEVSSQNALLDAAHSYLEFEVVNQSGGPTCGPDLGGAMNFFARASLEQGGKVLSRCDEFHRLHASILGPCQISSEGVAAEGVTGSRRSYNGPLAASIVVAPNAGIADTYITGSTHNSDLYWGNAFGHRFTMPVPGGLFNQDKLIPLPLVNPNQPLTIVLDLANAREAACWSAAGVIPGAFRIQAISYVAQLIEVGHDVIEQFRGVQNQMGGQLVLSGQDWEYSSNPVPAGTTGQQNLRLPVRKRSIKSVFWCAQSNDVANIIGAPADLGPTFNLSFAGNMNIASWGLKFGSVVFPSVPIECWGDNAAPAVGNFRRGECAMNLASAFGTSSWQNPTGTLSTITYGVAQGGVLADGDNGTVAPVPLATIIPESADVVGVCPFGISTEAFSREITESGVDVETLSQDTHLQLNWPNGIDSGNEDKICHMWCLFDQHYYFNRDGTVTYSN